MRRLAHRDRPEDKETIEAKVDKDLTTLLNLPNSNHLLFPHNSNTSPRTSQQRQ